MSPVALTEDPGPVMLELENPTGGASMFRRLVATAFVLTASAFQLIASQEPGSGPQVGEMVQGAFQALNVNGPFAGRQHSLVTDFRLNPVALVLVRAQPEGVDPEVKKLLEALDKIAEERHAATGLESFVVFLTPQARSSVTEDAGEVKDKAAQVKALVGEAVNREKLVNSLKEVAKPFKRLIVACCPSENIAHQYRLADKAEVTAVVYDRLRVRANFVFAEGQLKQEGIDNVLRAVDSAVDRLKKSTLQAKNDG
jgi:hypothetical protein